MFDIDQNEIDPYANTFTKEPVFDCPACNAELHTDWVDNGFGPYSVQASPYGCECGWHEMGCKECIKEKCFSWIKCHGRALIVKPAVQDSVINTMTDPNIKEEEVKAPATETEQEQVPAPAPAAGEAMESAEEEG